MAHGIHRGNVAGARFAGDLSVALCLLGGFLLCNSGIARAWPRSQEPAAAPPPTLTGDDIAVYNAAFQDLYQAEKGRPIILVDTTAVGVPPGMISYTSVPSPETGKFLEKLSPEARADYQQKNRTPLRLTAPCKLAPECSISDILALAEMVKNAKGWKNFYHKYPNAPGIVIVSRIGFSSDRNEAVLYAGASCNTLCGQGYYVRLVKKDAVWFVEDRVTTWFN